VFGARTVELTAGVGDNETERFVGPVADGEALVSVFDLPIRSTDLPPMNRRIAAVAVGGGSPSVSVRSRGSPGRGDHLAIRAGSRSVAVPRLANVVVVAAGVH